MRNRQSKAMMTIPYRYRRGLKRFLITLAVLTLVLVAAILSWMLWLSRYVIYTDEGAKIDFNLPFDYSQGELAQFSTTAPSVPIVYGNTDDLLNPSTTQLTQLSGYVVTTEMLETKLPAVQEALEQLPGEATVLLDVKNLQGEFAYPSSLGRGNEKIDTQAVSNLITSLKEKNCYLIARFSAFRDYWYFLEDEATRVPYGLPKKNGNGSLWPDTSVAGNLHYWFNPAAVGTQNYLVQVITELRTLGFDEVVFNDFRFPATDDIRFEGDWEETLRDTAKTLVQACGTESFALSFVGGITTLPEGRCRVYLENVAAADISQAVSKWELENPTAQLVFLTDLNDTRYDAYGVLRPLPIS
ncbi:MAG: hypothetical protein E7454_00445 [Ruminococcaceae bacterium]|nr:hypothetical protein [Oscillospiraceae bacterium]